MRRDIEIKRDVLEIFAEAQREEYFDGDGFSFAGYRDSVARYHESVAAGECVEENCSDQAEPGKARCQLHLMQKNRRQNERRTRMAATGQCAACFAPIAQHRGICEGCAAVTQAYNRTRRARVLGSGARCQRCLCRPPAPGRKRCLECAAKVRAYRVAHRVDCIARGTCPRCESRPRLPDTQTCAVCRPKNNRSAKSRHHTIGQS